MRRVMVGMLAAAVLTVACGKSEEEKRAEEAAKAAEQTAQSAEAAASEAAKGLEAMAKGLEQMAGGGGTGKQAEPVKLQDLLATLPQLDGWEQQKPEGERMTSPFATANAKATYIRTDANVDIEVVDSAFNQMLLAPVSMFLTAGYSKESTTGYEKSTTVNGHPGWEKWDSEIKAGELHALVGKRFLVSIEGDNIENTQVLKDIASKMDFNRLAALK